MNKVEARFIVEKLISYPGQVNVTMKAAIKDCHNKNWSQYTPNGIIEMTITNAECLNYFVPGDEIKVIFEKD